MFKPLSYFVKYKEAVDNVSVSSNSEHLINLITDAIGILSSDVDFDVDKLLNQREKIKQDLNEFDLLLDSFKSTVDVDLRKRELSYLNKSQKAYEDSRNGDTPEYIIKRFHTHPIASNKEIKKRIIHSISMHCSWEQPGLIIRPGLADIIDPMIALDPLYIMDENLLLLDHVKSLWNEIYQSRIRYGIIDDQSNDIFKNLPKSQFGFVLVNDFFNYKPFDIIKKYTQEIYGLLKPGGSMIFTYNNCDYANAVRNFENLLYTYTPGSLIIKMLEFIGFEVTTTFSDSNDNTNWIEVKKPGKLSTLRGGQCLGKINI